MAANLTPLELKHALLERLMHYYHFVAEKLDAGGGEHVTSTQIAELLHMDDTLVRKDLAAAGVRGVPHVGYKAEEVVNRIRMLLGFDEGYQGVIIGAGRMGGAMASYQGFSRYGLKITALFDNDPGKIGLIWGDYMVQPMGNLPLFAKNSTVDIAILTVPGDVAQVVASQVVAAGVRTIWNFANTSVAVPANVFVRHEHISVGLAGLSYFLKRQRADERAAAENAAED